MSHTVNNSLNRPWISLFQLESGLDWHYNYSSKTISNNSYDESFHGEPQSNRCYN